MRIALERISVAYGGRPAIAEVTLEASPGTVTALVGPNGSGKSTLLKAIAGLVPASGQRRFDGRAARAGRGDAAEAGVALLAQDAGAMPLLCAIEVVLLGRVGSLGLGVPRAELDAVRQVLEELELIDLADRIVAELSGGQRQMLYLAQVLAARPSVLLLDEPTSALDLRNQMEMLEALRRTTRRRGLTTMIAIHDINAAVRYADSVAVLCDGRLVASGAPAEVVTEAMLAQVYGVDAAVGIGADGRPAVTPLRARRPTPLPTRPQPIAESSQRRT